MTNPQARVPPWDALFALQASLGGVCEEASIINYAILTCFSCENMMKYAIMT